MKQNKSAWMLFATNFYGGNSKHCAYDTVVYADANDVRTK